MHLTHSMVLRVISKSGYHLGDGGPRIKNSISWFEDGLVGFVHMGMLTNPIVIFSDSFFSNGHGVFPEKPLKVKGARGMSLCLV